MWSRVGGFVSWLGNWLIEEVLVGKIKKMMLFWGGEGGSFIVQYSVEVINSINPGSPVLAMDVCIGDNLVG